MQARLRPAIPADAEAVRRCIAMAFEPYIARIGRPPGPMTIDVAGEIGAGHVWVAAAGVAKHASIVGVLVQYRTPLGFYIDTVAVEPRLHGTGIGKALLQFAEQEALRCGFDSIYLCTNAQMTENQAFYPRIGYVEMERRAESGYDRVFYRKALGAA